MQIVPVKVHEYGGSCREACRGQQDQVTDSGLLPGLALGGLRHCRVVRLDVTAELYPELPFAVETQEHLVEAGRKHETRRRDVFRAAVTPQGGIPCRSHELQICVPRP